MAVWSEYRLAALPDDRRLDAEYYQPAFLKLDHTLKDRAVSWGDILGRFIVGPFGSLQSIGTGTYSTSG